MNRELRNEREDQKKHRLLRSSREYSHRGLDVAAKQLSYLSTVTQKHRTIVLYFRCAKKLVPVHRVL